MLAGNCELLTFSWKTDTPASYDVGVILYFVTCTGCQIFGIGDQLDIVTDASILGTAGVIHGGDPHGNEIDLVSESCRFAGFELQLQPVGNEGYKFGIRGFSLGVADGIPEKSL